MHQLAPNPPTPGGPRGRTRRNFSGTTRAYRHFCSDSSTERNLITLRDWLQGKIEAGDVLSISLLARRALDVYRSHVAAMSPQDREREKIEVRRSSRMPNPNPRKRPNRSKKKPLVTP